MEEKEGWTYGYSEELKQKFAYKNTPAGIVLFTEDKTRYTQKEIEIINRKSVVIPAQVHAVKHIFEGEIIS